MIAAHVIRTVHLTVRRSRERHLRQSSRLENLPRPLSRRLAPTESGETINPTLARVAPVEVRTEGDRQERDRNNDDRRRRSRRRRTRGRGFPENKYAAAGSATPEPERSAYTAPEAPIRQEEAATPGSASDLLILPGESLAKYRQGGGARVVEDSEREAAHELAELSPRPLGRRREARNRIEDRRSAGRD